MYHNKDAFHTSEHKQTHVIQTSLVVLAALFLPRGKKNTEFLLPDTQNVWIIDWFIESTQASKQLCYVSDFLLLLQTNVFHRKR